MLLCFVQFGIGEGGRGEERYKKQTVEIITSGRLAGTSQAGQNILGRRPPDRRGGYKATLRNGRRDASSSGMI